MNSTELKAQLLSENVARFGRWASKRKRDSAEPIALIFEEAPKNELEAQQHGNALAATGNYPAGTSDCFNVGIAGGCGAGCFVFRAGRCPEPDGIGD